MYKSIFYLTVSFFIACPFFCSAQYGEPIKERQLTEVLPKIEKIYHVKFVYNNDIVNGLKVYAPAGLTSNLENTLDDILKPTGLIYTKTSSDTYLITEFETLHKRSIEEGAKQLDELLKLYSNDIQFSQRKKELRDCIFKTLGINRNLKNAPLKPIIGGKNKMDGYLVQNVAFESLPGYYVTGSLYAPLNRKGPFPVILCPHGHFYSETDRSLSQDSGRYRPDMQIRCAALAKMGAIVLNYDMYSWGESVLETGSYSSHYTGFSLAIQTLNSIRCLDFLLSLPNADKRRVGVTGASGGGMQNILLSALDDRVTASVPVVMVSSSFDGGCECESGLPIHKCGRYEINNAEIAAMTAPRPQLIISEDCDWTKSVPGTDYPYLQKVYAFYGKKNNIENVHLHDKHHDYGYTKRIPMYKFFAKIFGLDLDAIIKKDGSLDESGIKIQNSRDMLIFTDRALPSDILKSNKEIMQTFKSVEQPH